MLCWVVLIVLDVMRGGCDGWVTTTSTNICAVYITDQLVLIPT